MHYKIHKSRTSLYLTEKNSGRTIISGVWWITWGKYKSEISDSDNRVIYTISRKFFFWKWKMTYTIKDVTGNTFLFEGRNKSHTIYQAVIKEDTYEVKIHKKRKRSVFKNGIQIASIDESLIGILGSSKGLITTSNPENITEIFVLFFCLNFGVKDDNSITFNFGNIGKAEPIDENWKA